MHVYPGYLLCFTVLLTIAIDSCLLFADRHVCMNVQLQGTKRIFMFAMECASKLHKLAAARLMSKLLTMNSGYRGWYRANFIAVWYARQYQREALDIYNTSKVQYIHDINGEGHIPPNTTTYDHIRTFTSKQIKFTWY